MSLSWVYRFTTNELRTSSFPPDPTFSGIRPVVVIVLLIKPLLTTPNACLNTADISLLLCLSSGLKKQLLFAGTGRKFRRTFQGNCNSKSKWRTNVNDSGPRDHREPRPSPFSFPETSCGLLWRIRATDQNGCPSNGNEGLRSYRRSKMF